jgi:hypothetical protein
VANEQFILDLPGAAHKELPRGMALFDPHEAILGAVLQGCARQQQSRQPNVTTISQRQRIVRALYAFTDELPMALTGHIEPDENSAPYERTFDLRLFSLQWTMALTGHTERMKMRSGANGRSIFSYLHMSGRWP